MSPHMTISRLYEAPKLRSFEAFVIVIEISIFGFENSTLHHSNHHSNHYGYYNGYHDCYYNGYHDQPWFGY